MDSISTPDDDIGDGFRRIERTLKQSSRFADRLARGTVVTGLVSGHVDARQYELIATLTSSLVHIGEELYADVSRFQESRFVAALPVDELKSLHARLNLIDQVFRALETVTLLASDLVAGK